MVQIFTFQFNLTLKVEVNHSTKNRDLNQGLLHFWSKYWMIFRADNLVVHPRTQIKAGNDNTWTPKLASGKIHECCWKVNCKITGLRFLFCILLCISAQMPTILLCGQMLSFKAAQIPHWIDISQDLTAHVYRYSKMILESSLTKTMLFLTRNWGPERKYFIYTWLHDVVYFYF